MNKHQPESGQDIEKLLTEITPQADVHFQGKLERQVLAAYRQKKEGDKVKANGHLVTYTDFVPKLGLSKNRQRRWSISSAATLMMVFFVGLMLMSIEGKPQGGFSGASRIITATPSPTPIATVPVVVASQDLKGNQIIRFSDVKIQDYPANQVPEDAFSDVNEVIGAQLLTNVLVGRPILERSISSERVFSVLNNESPFGYLGDPVVVAYPRGSLTVNVRASPDTESEILGQMEQGTGYLVINRNEDWYQILYTASKKGWVLQNFVFTRGDTTSVLQITLPINVVPAPMEGFSFVVIGVKDLPRGTLITPDMLEVQQWRSDAVPLTSFTQMEDLIGAITKTDIPSESPILESQVFLPDELSAMGLPFEVYIGLEPIVMATQTIQRGTVITEEMLTLAYWPSELVTAEMYDNIETLVGQRLVTDLRPYAPILSEYLENGAGTEIDAGHVAIAVPLPDDAYFYGFQVGDTISITASFLFVEPYEVNGVQTTPAPVLPESGGGEPTDNLTPPQLVVQEVIPDAKIVNLGEMAVTEEGDLQVMVLAVTPEQAEVLTWLLDSQIPLQYRIVISDTSAQGNPPTSEQPQSNLPNELGSMDLPPDASSELKPIVITTQAIPRGTIITEEMLTIGYTASELASLVPFDNIETYVGRMAITNLSAYSLILDDQVVAFGEGRTPPIGDEYITIPFYSATNEYPALGVPGDHVDIIATLLTVANDDASVFCRGAFSPNGTPLPCPELDNPEHTQSVKQKVVEDAEVISVNLVGSQSGDFTTATLKMSPEDIELMNSLLDAEVPLVYIVR